MCGNVEAGVQSQKREPGRDDVGGRPRYRMDFVNEVESVDEKKGILRVVMRPDPRRYEWIERDGENLLYDRYDQVYFGPEALKQLADQMDAVPIRFQPAGIAYAPDYVRDRKERIRECLRGESNQEDRLGRSDKSDDFLDQLADHARGFAILSMDMVGSTKLITQLPREDYNRILDTLLFEASRVVPAFHGHVLKYVGDGLIAYFPEPNFITKSDLAVDCALTIHGLVYAAINPCLTEVGLETIEVRIGIDSGEASVFLLGSGQTKRHADIIGAVVSLASKVQNSASPGEIWLGEILERNLHVMWREICEACAVPANWPYRGLDGHPYKVLRIQNEALERNLRSMAA